MNPKDFTNTNVGQIVMTPTKYHAFIPNPLPRSVDDLSAKLFLLESEAEHVIGKLSGIGYLVPNPDFLVIPYTRLEAVSSARIEGTQASLSELFYFEAASERKPVSDDLLEVKNYLDALNYGLNRLETLPLSLRLVRELHQRVMANVRGGTPDKTPGEFRKSQNWIGPPGCSLADATYVPPPPSDLIAVLDDWEKFLHQRDKLPVLVQCAMMHYQFEAAHPFLDGNGRVGRLLITLFLCERQILPYPLLYLSAFFETNRDEYYRRLLAVSQKGDWEGWILYFLRGVIVQGNRAIESAKLIVDQREQYRTQLQENRASATMLRMLDYIFTNPYIANVSTLAKQFHVSTPTAQKAVSELQSLNIIEEITGNNRNRIYVARHLLELMAGKEPIYRPNSQRD